MTDDVEITRLAAALGSALSERELWMVTAESCTGGGIAAACTAVDGASSWLWGGFVTYTIEAKQQLISVPVDLLERHGAVSEPVARAMAEGALAATPADLAVSVTGIAGPGGGEVLQPVGTVWFGWALKEGADIRCMQTAEHHLSGSRQMVRLQAVRIALDGVLALC